MIYKMKNRGITLIALVVTVIVILVLAGISISMLTGENGILNRTAEAKEKTNDSQDLEYLKLKATEALMDYYQKNTTENEDEYILDKWDADKNNKIEVNSVDKTVTYNGKVYSIGDIVGNESEKGKLEEEGLKRITVANAKNLEDKNLLSNGKVRIIVEEENGMRAVIPNGFYYVTGKPSNGLVISDRYGDDDNNSKGGNQFVWVPCSEETGATSSTTNGTEVTYEKVNGLAVTWKKYYSDKQYYYTKIPSGNNVGQEIVDWKDDGGNLNSIKKYKGFYIARYEAGLPADEKLWSWKDNATYGWTNGKEAGSLDGDRNTNIDAMTPVSKKNNASWNRVSQVNAVKLSKKMYEGSLVVTSSLVDSYAWDTIITWYTKTGINCSSSLGYGNYFDTVFGETTEKNKMSLKNVLYAVHTYNLDNGWVTLDKKYHLITNDIGYSEIDSKKEEKDRIKTVYEIATGSSDYCRKNNIYDLAGNMWEWTMEIGNHSIDSSNSTGKSESYAVRRGGCIVDGGGYSPVSIRDGYANASKGYHSIGFRVVLYLEQ